jgi:hypothetical protein
MPRGLYHPKNGPKCAFCKRWTGDADLVFKHPTTGFEFSAGVFGKCMATNSTQPSTGGSSCKKYEPSVEASRIL